MNQFQFQAKSLSNQELANVSVMFAEGLGLSSAKIDKLKMTAEQNVFGFVSANGYTSFGNNRDGHLRFKGAMPLVAEDEYDGRQLFMSGIISPDQKTVLIFTYEPVWAGIRFDDDNSFSVYLVNVTGSVDPLLSDIYGKIAGREWDSSCERVRKFMRNREFPLESEDVNGKPLQIGHQFVISNYGPRMESDEPLILFAIDNEYYRIRYGLGKDCLYSACIKRLTDYCDN